MPTNTIRVTWSEEEGYRCGVWDAQGHGTEVTDIFNAIVGGTGEGRVWNEIRCARNTLITKLEFKAVAKNMSFEVKPDVIAQILQLHGGGG